MNKAMPFSILILLLIVTFFFGFATYHVFFNIEEENCDDCVSAYKVSRLSNIYAKIIYDASYFGEVQEETKVMIQNYKIEFGETVPPIKVSVVGDN